MERTGVRNLVRVARHRIHFIPRDQDGFGLIGKSVGRDRVDKKESQALHEIVNREATAQVT